MNTQPNDVQSILRRIETLESQNRRLKKIAVGGFMFPFVALLCGFAAGGHQTATPSDSTVQAQENLLRPKQDDECTKDKFTLPMSFPFNSAASGELTFRQMVRKTPTVRDKLDFLACMAETLQAQVTALQEQVFQVRVEKANFDYVSKSLIHHADLIDQIGALAADNDSRIRAIQFGYAGANPLKRELDEFKDAACPILRRAEVGWATKLKIDSACGLH